MKVVCDSMPSGHMQMIMGSAENGDWGKGDHYICCKVVVIIIVVVVSSKWAQFYYERHLIELLS